MELFKNISPDCNSQKKGLSKLFILIFFNFLLALNAEGQSSEGSNPVIFAEIFTGAGFGSAGGLGTGLELSFQNDRDLYSFRSLSTIKLSADILHPFFPLPLLQTKSTFVEFAGLYGWRFVEGATGYSFSLGLSYNIFESFDPAPAETSTTTHAVGVPFELNVKWFKSEKKRYRILWFIPIGEPTAFGKSFGFKIFGNVSKRSLIGIAASYGLGTHKKY